jgi:hypothetical protein
MLSFQHPLDVLQKGPAPSEIHRSGGPPLAILNGMAMVVDEDNLVGIDNRLVLHGVDGDKNMFCCAAIQ